MTTKPPSVKGRRRSYRGAALQSAVQPSTYLTVAEVADLLRTTRKAIYARIGRGLLPGVIRDGQKGLLIEREVLVGWLAKRRAASPGEPER